MQKQGHLFARSGPLIGLSRQTTRGQQLYGLYASDRQLSNGVMSNKVELGILGNQRVLETYLKHIAPGIEIACVHSFDRLCRPTASVSQHAEEQVHPFRSSSSSHSQPASQLLRSITAQLAGKHTFGSTFHARSSTRQLGGASVAPPPLSRIGSDTRGYAWRADRGTHPGLAGWLSMLHHEQFEKARQRQAPCSVLVLGRRTKMKCEVVAKSTHYIHDGKQ